MLKSPFNYNHVEKDPDAYGLREEIIVSALTELYNDNSIMLTGTRGIGKTSMSVQLQKVLEGDTRLLKRCDVNLKFTDYITLSYTCFASDSLEKIIFNLIDKLETEAEISSKKYKISSAKIDLSLFGILKGEICLEKKDKTDYDVLADKFVKAVIRISEIFVDAHVNIFIDEIDKLDDSIDIAHFIKVVNEMLDREDYENLSFIIAGQIGAYNKLLKNQPSFERIVHCFELKPLDIDNSDYVLKACLGRAKRYIDITDGAAYLLVVISCGYPFWIHKLGHESFLSMLMRNGDEPSEEAYYLIEERDVLNGLSKTLQGASQKYNEIIDTMPPMEKEFIFYLVNINPEKIPCIYKESDIAIFFKDKGIQGIEVIIESLIEKNILKLVATKDLKPAYCFLEELFRIYIKYNLIMKREELNSLIFKPVSFAELPLDTSFRFI